MSALRYCVLLLAALATPLVIVGQPSSSDDSNKLSSLEERKLKLESDRLELEREKFNEDKKNKREGFWVSAIQVGGAIIAIGVPIWLAYWQSRTETKRRRADEALQFQLKVAEIALDATESSLAAGKAAALKALFPDRLPPGFDSSLAQKNVSFGPGREMRLQFLKILAEHPESREFLTDVWGLMWPGDGADPNWSREKWSTYKWWVELKKYLKQQKSVQKS